MYTKRNAADWTQLVRDWQASGVSQTQFCSDNNLSHGSFWVWKKRVLGDKSTSHKGASAKKSLNSFIQFSPSTAGKIEISLNGSGAKIVLDATDKQSLHTVLTALNELPHK